MSAAGGQGQSGERKRKRPKYDMETAPFGGDLPRAIKDRVVGTKYRNRDGEMVIAMTHGAVTCPCGRHKYICKKCGGGGLCACWLVKTKCSSSGGSGLSTSGIAESRCVMCGGGEFCSCGKIRYLCAKCGGGGLCPCGKQKSRCKKCGGGGMCPCGKQRPQCKKCGGSSYCPCGKFRTLCAKCGGGGLCPCRKQKQHCTKCFTLLALAQLTNHRCCVALKASRYNDFILHVGHTTADAEALLGCTLKHFQHHIEAQFTDGMTWANHGNDGWHIDHIRPVCTFDLSEAAQRHACFHFSNTQPMWATENMKKSHKWRPELAAPEHA